MVLACNKDMINILFIIIIGEVMQFSVFGVVDGVIDIVVEGGVLFYQVFWSYGLDIEDVFGLLVGSYIVKIIDIKFMVVLKIFELLQFDVIFFDFNFIVEEVIYFGGNDGMVIVLVSGGISFYIFFWSNEEDIECIEKFIIGWYIVIVIDSGEFVIIIIDFVLVGQLEFVCGCDSIIDVDGNKYLIVDIGG